MERKKEERKDDEDINDSDEEDDNDVWAESDVFRWMTGKER